MLKNMFGQGKESDSKKQTDERPETINNDDVSSQGKTPITSDTSALAGKHENFGKKSRKKLTAMMGKMMHHNGNKNQNKIDENDRNNNYYTRKQSNGNATRQNNAAANDDDNDDDDDDDDLFYDLELDESNSEQQNSGQQDLPKLSQKQRLSIVSNGHSVDDKLLPEEQCDIPTFLNSKNCDQYLIEETRKLLKERYAKNPDSFYDDDYQRMLSDDWTVSRFLLRRRLDPKRTAKLMEECGKFRKQFKMSEIQLWEFPIEFHKAGGLFKYAKDRVGNITVYMRVKMYRRVPEISDVFKAFILCVLEEADMANNGRGVAVIFDLSGCGLQNVDLGFLSWLLSSFRNYCPKGVSYILVYNLPWILNATCKMAMSWMSASNRRSLRFCYGDEIENFIAIENLPDYLGGTCGINYKAVPEGSLPATEVCDRLDMTREQALKIRELFKEYLDEDDYANCKSNDDKTVNSKKQDKKQKKKDRLRFNLSSQKKSIQSIEDDSTGVNEEANGSDLLSTTTTNNNSTSNNQSSSTELVMQASKFSII